MKRTVLHSWVGGMLACVMMLSMFGISVSAAYPITNDTVIYRTDTTLADGLTYESIYAEKNGISQRGYLFTYQPGKSVLPLVTYGTSVVGRETTGAMMRLAQTQLDVSGMRVVGGINGDFFSMKTGIPMGVMIQDGIILTSDAGEAAIGIKADGTYLMGVPSITTALHLVSEDTSDTLTLPVAHINKYPAVWGAYLCTPAYGKTTYSTEAGTEYVFTVTEGAFSLTSPVSATLTEIRMNSKNSEIPADGFVIYLHPKCTQAKAYEALAVGDTVNVTVSAAEGWQDVTLALGGGDILIENGEIHSENFDKDHGKNENPRTAVGYTVDGKLCFFAVDGRTTASKGMTLEELAQTMASLGCVGAINLDGGGSTTVIVRGDSQSFTVMNKPTDGVERKVSNAVLFVDGSVSDGIPYYAEITPDSPLVYRNAPVDLDVTITDRSHTPLDPEDMQITWSAVGGTIDQNGHLTPDGTTQNVTVTAQIRVSVLADEPAVGSDEIADEETGEIPGDTAGEAADAPAENRTGGFRFETEDDADNTADDAADESTAAVTEYVFTAQETVYRTDTLDGIKADVQSLTIPFGSQSAPVTVSGVWKGNTVRIASSDVAAGLQNPDAQIGTGGYVDRMLSVHSTSSMQICGEETLANGFPRTNLILQVKDSSGKAHTIYVPVTFGAAPQAVMTMDKGMPDALFTFDSTAKATRLSSGGRNGSAAVSVTGQWIAPVRTPAADLPVKRVDLYVRGTYAKDLHAVVICGGTEYTLPWTVSDDFSRIGGWIRISLDTTVIDAHGISGFTFAKLISSETPFALTVEDLTYFFGDSLPSFSDTHGSWVSDSAELLYRMGVINGIPNENGTFRFEPSGALSRAEFAVMIAKFMGLSLSEGVSLQEFSDVDDLPEWAVPYIAAVTEAEYMRGKGSGDSVRFAAEDTMTRAEVLQVLGALLDVQEEIPTVTAFADDSDIPDWARTNIAKIVQFGLISGYEDNTLRPTAVITRAEIAALMARIHGIFTQPAEEPTAEPVPDQTTDHPT